MAKKEVSTEQRVEQLKALLPEAFSEGTLNFERLASTLGMDFSAPSHESYGLQWVGKQEAQNTAKTPSTTVLHTTDGVEETPPSDKDILIEGDNLEALKILSDTHAGKVDVIYIDPPYNTGQDFVYLDNFRESP
ncbi:MAG TPA: site-specific DNA-methyltransferase, partial [Myxococcales bacterium]|nr:site-specific DNA-methyltransferase [Myxococcales bacterium]